MRLPKCLCSKCQFFLRGNVKRGQNAEDLDGYMDHLDGPARLNYFEQREYQTALIEIATKRNIIACLPTGSGKTFIAYKLIEHFQHDIASKGKKVFFLANTIPLVNQQAAFFARNLTLKVKHITGDMEVDYWSPDKWDAIINDCQILAMTAQIFLNIIRHAYIKFSQIALVIFDECHHAQNDHPMKHIMVEYNTTKRNYPEYDMPRILGLTATIIMGNCKTSDVPTRIRELENTMSSIAVTYKDYEEVMRHSTSAVLQPVRIEKEISYSYSSFMSALGIYATELQVLRKERKKLKANVLSIQGIDPTLKATSNIYLCNKKPSPGDLRIAVDDVRRTFEDMGEYCAVIAINLRLAFIEFSLLDLTDDIIKSWYHKIRTVFIEFKQSILKRMERSSDENKVIQFITPKLRKLIDILEENFRASGDSSNACECGDNDNQLCGLVFTDRRVTAQVLAWYLKDLAAMNERYAFIKANFVVGTSRCPFETVESRIYAKKQTATINGFRSQRFNLLTATSVLEEGIDVPSCNLVVRFDPIKTYTSYVQSMGRARKRNALFYAFLDSDFYSRDEPKLRVFREINDAMVSYLRAQVLKIDEGIDRKFDHVSEHSIEPFCPGGTADSPRVTMESAQEIIENYCMLLPNDGISSLQTISWWTEHGLSFMGHLKLPMNSALKGVVEGLIMNTKLLAKQSVHFEAVKKLYELDALDQRLCPTRPIVPLKVESFFTKLTPLTATGDEKDVNTAGAEIEDGEIPEVGTGDVDADAAFLARLFRKDWFRKKVPEIFQRRQLVIGERYNIYRFCIELTEPNPKNKWQELYKLESSKTAFGIISAEDIPDIGKFPLFGIFGTLSVRLEKIPDFSVNLRAENFRILRDFQRIIFRDVLDLQHPLLEGEEELSFAIIPLEKGDEGWRVYSNLFPRRDEEPGINSIFTIARTRMPRDEIRRNSARGNRFEQDRIRTYVRKFTDAVVYPWYKGRSGPIYVVDTVELEMSPLSRFHDGFHSNYKNFIKTQHKKEIYNNDQPLLKCKLAGVGKGMKQLNYLLEKPTKEDEFPVYLVPELCFVLPIPASILVQVKFLPSILHRFFRLLIAKEILDSVGESCQWDGLLKNSDSTKFDPENIEIFTSAQDQDRAKEEERRKMREEARTRLN